MGARDRLLRKALRERFVVTLTSGETFDGLLIDVDDRTLTLANAHAISGAERVKVDGLLYIPRPVAYMQKPEASG